MAEKKTYFVAEQRLKHSKTQEYHKPGEVVDLSHLSPDGQQILIDRGAVREATPEEIAQTEAARKPQGEATEAKPAKK
jgi:hypothetical protein